MKTKSTVGKSSTTITGLVVPYNETGEKTSFGAPVRFLEGSAGWDPEISRVKLMREHDTTTPIGTCTEIYADATGVHATFEIPHIDATEEIRQELDANLRAGLSVGADILQAHWEQDTYVVSRFRITEVSLVAIPAFPTTRATISAARKETKDMPVPHLTFSAPVEEPDEETPETTEETTEEPDTTEEAPEAPQVTASFRQAGPRHAHTKAVTVTAAAQKISSVLNMGGHAADVRAALADVTPASDKGEGFLRPAFLGELWTARRTVRPIIDAITKKDLPTGTKVEGWRWKERPQVDAYQGNKKEIPTNKVSTEAVEAPIERTAGGWDVDRIFLDLGSASMIESLFEAALEDYAVKTEAKAQKAILDAATKIDGATADTATAALSKIAHAAWKVGANISFIGVSADVMTDLMETPADMLPAWAKNATFNLGTQTAQPGSGLTISVVDTLEASTVLALDSRASTWFEKTPPVRVNAIDLAHGGVDLGVFGYHGQIINDARAIHTMTLGTSPKPGTSPEAGTE